MISISGIKDQAQLELLPYFTKSTAGMLIGKDGKNLDKKIEQLANKGYLISLKKGMYVTDPYYSSVSNKELYLEYVANILRYPSYLSLEYMLSKYNLIPEATYQITSITNKSTRLFQNQLGSFAYRSIKNKLFTGYSTVSGDTYTVAIATKAKTLFDFLYLKRNLGKDLETEIKASLRINWSQLQDEDIREFKSYVKLSNSAKMERIAKYVNK